MGNFYVNYTLGKVKQQAVADVLKGRQRIVAPEMNDTVVVFDSQSDLQDPKIISALVQMLSKHLNCPVLVVLNHDDDILWYELYSGGVFQDEYNSAPSYFDFGGSELSGPKGGDAKKLCSAFGSTNVDQVEQILRRSIFDGGYAFAVERHNDLVNALGISTYAVGATYKSFDAGELPEDLAV